MDRPKPHSEFESMQQLEGSISLQRHQLDLVLVYHICGMSSPLLTSVGIVDTSIGGLRVSQ